MGSGLVQQIYLRQAGLWTNDRFKKTLLGVQVRDLRISEGLEFNQESHTAAVTCLSLDRLDEQYVLAGFGDGTISIHDIYGERTDTGYRSNVELRIGRSSRFVHSRAVETVCWYVDNGMFLSSGRDGKLQVWDSERGIVVEDFKVGQPINKHCIGEPEVGALVAVATNTNHLQLVDLRTGATCHTLGSRTLGGHTLEGHSGEVYCCSWSKSNPWILASGSADKKIMLWDVRQSRSYLAYLDYNNVRYKKMKDIKLANMSHQAGVHGLVYSSCGRYLYSLGSDKRIRKWDTLTLKNLKTKFPEVETKCRGSIDMVSVEAGDKDLLFLPENTKIAVFDAVSGSRVGGLDGHLYNVNCLDIGRTKVQLYSGGRDRFILQWDTPLQIAAARASKEERDEKKSEINPYTVDSWTSDEDEI